MFIWTVLAMLLAAKALDLATDGIDGKGKRRRKKGAKKQVTMRVCPFCGAEQEVEGTMTPSLSWSHDGESGAEASEEMWVCKKCGGFCDPRQQQ